MYFQSLLSNRSIQRLGVGLGSALSTTMLPSSCSQHETSCQMRCGLFNINESWRNGTRTNNLCRTFVRYMTEKKPELIINSATTFPLFEKIMLITVGNSRCSYLRIDFALRALSIAQNCGTGSRKTPDTNQCKIGKRRRFGGARSSYKCGALWRDGQVGARGLLHKRRKSAAVLREYRK